MEDNEIKLLTRLFQDAEIGMISIDKVIKKIEDSAIRKMFIKQYEAYDKFKERCDVLAVNSEIELKENSTMKKFKQTAVVYLSLWKDKSCRHIIEMMITGTVMGIVDTIKTRADCGEVSPELSVLVADFQKMQEDFYEKLKKQLAKV